MNSMQKATLLSYDIGSLKEDAAFHCLLMERRFLAVNRLYFARLVCKQGSRPVSRPTAAEIRAKINKSHVCERCHSIAATALIAFTKQGAAGGPPKCRTPGPGVVSHPTLY